MRLLTIKSCLECGQSLTNKGACFICINTGVDAKRWLAPSRREQAHTAFSTWQVIQPIWIISPVYPRFARLMATTLRIHLIVALRNRFTGGSSRRSSSVTKPYSLSASGLNAKPFRSATGPIPRHLLSEFHRKGHCAARSLYNRSH